MTITTERALELTARGYEQIAARRAFVQRTEDYYTGRQRLRFASDKWSEYNASRYRDFSDNWCAPVANSTNERLRVTGFRLDEDPDRSDAEKGLWEDWQDAEMDAQSSQGFLASIISGRSYVLVWGSERDEPVATWERADQMTIVYEAERPWVSIAALKCWNDGDTEYATLYTEDQVWKWQRRYLRVEPAQDLGNPRADTFFRTTSGLAVPAVGHESWEPREVRSEPWPLSHPMGVVPAVEVPNRPMLGREPLSDIAGTIAMQDAINLLWAYLFAAADHASMPARVVMGQDPPKVPVLDQSGTVVGEKPVDMKKLAQDRILWLTGEKASIGQWEAAKLDVFTGTIETAVTHIAAQTRTPPHYLVMGKGMVNISAEGMKTAETGLVMKVREMHLFLDVPVRGVMRRMALVRGNAALAEQARRGTVEWKDAENHSEAQLVDALTKLSGLGFPFQWIAERYGLSATEIKRVMEMKEAEPDPLTQMVAMAGQQPAAQEDPQADPTQADQQA